jgi:hypothetical protein
MIESLHQQKNSVLLYEYMLLLAVYVVLLEKKQPDAAHRAAPGHSPRRQNETRCPYDPEALARHAAHSP